MIAAFFALPAPIKAAWATLAGVVIGGLAIIAWLHFHDKKVVEQHEAGIAAKVAAATQAANDVANTNDTARQVENAKAAILTEEAIRHAEQDHPAEVRAASGPAVNAVAEQLRHRAAASSAPAR